jgi:hypothetical protein
MTYIRTAILFFCLGLLPLFTLAQTKETQIKAIRQTFQQINSDPNLKKVVLNSEAFMEQATDGGGELTGFYKDGKLVKIVEWIGLSDGNRVVEFYFRDNTLIFVYGQFKAWVYDAKRDEFDHSKTRTIFEGRYYFNQQKIIERKLSGRMHADDEAFYMESNLLATASNYTQVLNRKNQ